MFKINTLFLGLLIILFTQGCMNEGPEIDPSKQGQFEEEKPIEGKKEEKNVAEYSNYNDDILYNNINDEENITILLNYFVQKEFDDAIPLLPPKKELLRGDEERFDDYKKRVLDANKNRIDLAQRYNKQLKQQKDDIVKIVQRSLNKAIGVVYGRPRFIGLSFNLEKKTLLTTTIGTNLKFQEETVFQIDEADITLLQENFKYMSPKIIFDYSNHELSIRGVMFIYKNKKYFGRFTKQKFTDMHIPLVVDFKKYQNIY